MTSLLNIFINTYVELFIYTLLLWVAFIAVATIKNTLFDKTHPLIVRIPFYLIGAAFWLFDAWFNKTYGSILFLELGEFEDLTLTSRLKHTLHSGEYSAKEWRFKVALFMCKYMIEPWDFGHCSLHKL